MGKKNTTQNIIVHFDLGGSKISALAGFVDENGALTILGEQMQKTDEIKSGIIEKVSGVAFKINELSKLLQNSLRIEPIRNITLSLNARSMKQIVQTLDKRIERTITEDFLERMKEECRMNVTTEKINVFDIEPLEYMIDGKYVENPVGHRGSFIHAVYRLIIGNMLVQESTERSFDRTGIAVDYIHVGVDALAIAILETEEKEEGCAMIAFGATTTTLAVYNEGKLQEMLVVPFGGLNITKDIQELGINFDYAELLKCKKGCAMEKFITNPVNIKAPAEIPGGEPVLISTSFLSTIIEARLTEMMEPVFELINQINYRLPAGIIITGGAAKLNNLKEFIIEKTGFQVRFGGHTDWLSDETDEKFIDPVYSQAVGAMLLTHDILSLKKEEIEPVKKAIEPKIKRPGIINKIGKSFNSGMQKLFEYDDMEMKKNAAEPVSPDMDGENADE